MTSFSTTHLVAWILFVLIATSTSEIVRRHLTNHQVEFNFDHEDDFPNVLPVVLKSPDGILNFNFTKRELNYNLPVYMRTPHSKEVVTLDTPPITNAGFYEDPGYGASVTLHCKGHGASPHMKKYCNIRLMSGFFHLNGHKHVIEPEKKDFKRVSFLASQKPNSKFIQKHRVYKLMGHNHNCNVKQNLKNILNRKTKTGKDRYKRSKPKYIIEVLALITQKDLTDEEELKKQKIYYTHVFWGVNMLYNNIDTEDASFAVNLIGFILEPETTHLYKFANNSNRDYLNGTLSLDLVAKHPSSRGADHVVMFSIHRISDNPSIVGLANVGAVCTPESVSMCMVLRSFEEIHVVAHEIGHSLNSIHDGEQNSCHANDGYIMTATTLHLMSTQHILNSFQFSRCSITAIKSYVSNLHPTNCLLTTVKSAIAPSKPTGQLFPPREQCKTSSRSSGLCSKIYTRSNSDICLSLICLKDENTCKSVVTAYKTTCGNKKWCVFGECVYDVNAPEADESCLFGDDDHLKFTIQFPDGSTLQPKNCSELLAKIPDFCTRPSHRYSCCSTCNQHENVLMPDTSTRFTRDNGVDSVTITKKESVTITKKESVTITKKESVTITNKESDSTNKANGSRTPPSSSTPLTSWRSFYLPSKTLSVAGYLRSQFVPVLLAVFYILQLRSYFVT